MGSSPSINFSPSCRKSYIVRHKVFHA